MEIWKKIEGVGMVSNYGCVKTLWHNKWRKRKPSRDRFGYLSTVLNYGDYKKKSMIHILVANAFIPNPLNKPEVNHKDSNPGNNHVSNLEWVTPKENVKHAILNSYRKRNGKHWKSKISTNDADFIRANFKKKYSARELSSMFGLDLSTVYSLLRGETWNKHHDKIRVFKRRAELE